MSVKDDIVASIAERAASVLGTARQELESLAGQIEALYQHHLSEWLEKKRLLEEITSQPGQERHQEEILQQRCMELDLNLTYLRQLSYKLDLLIRRNEDDFEYLQDRWEAPTDLSSDLTPMRIVQSQEEERQRIAREVQNEVGQLLANSVFELEYHEHLAGDDPKMAKEGLHRLKEELRQGLDKVRWLVSELQPPPLLSELGLMKSLQIYSKRYMDSFGIQVKLDLQALEERLPAIMELLIFRIIQEALQNIRKHASASQVVIKSRRERENLIFSIEDNGHGFSPELLDPQGQKGLGLISMQDRAALLRGKLRIVDKKEKGVQVVLSIPYPSEP
ncbi:MAG: sensor histidine kinase [Anaerolineae bacterium]